MHATGGKGLYQWMGHAFVCLLGSLTITQQLKENLVRLCCYDQAEAYVFSYKAAFYTHCISASGGRGGINTLMDSCFGKGMPNNGSAVSISLLMQICQSPLLPLWISTKSVLS